MLFSLFRLSTTIGWKPAVVTAAEVTEQAKALCGRYLRAKLRSCGPMHKKLGLQRLKSVSNMCSGYPTNDVSTKLRLICQELERTHPETFQVEQLSSNVLLSLTVAAPNQPARLAPEVGLISPGTPSPGVELSGSFCYSR